MILEASADGLRGLAGRRLGVAELGVSESCCDWDGDGDRSVICIPHLRPSGLHVERSTSGLGRHYRPPLREHFVAADGVVKRPERLDKQLRRAAKIKLLRRARSLSSTRTNSTSGRGLLPDGIAPRDPTHPLLPQRFAPGEANRFVRRGQQVAGGREFREECGAQMISLSGSFAPLNAFVFASQPPLVESRSRRPSNKWIELQMIDCLARQRPLLRSLLAGQQVVVELADSSRAIGNCLSRRVAATCSPRNCSSLSSGRRRRGNRLPLHSGRLEPETCNRWLAATCCSSSSALLAFGLGKPKRSSQRANN